GVVAGEAPVPFLRLDDVDGVRREDRKVVLERFVASLLNLKIWRDGVVGGQLLEESAEDEALEVADEASPGGCLDQASHAGRPPPRRCVSLRFQHRLQKGERLSIPRRHARIVEGPSLVAPGAEREGPFAFPECWFRMPWTEQARGRRPSRGRHTALPRCSVGGRAA